MRGLVSKRRALPFVANAALQTLVLAAGIAVTLDLERTLLVDWEPPPQRASSSMFQHPDGGMGFSITTACGGQPMPPFAPRAS